MIFAASPRAGVVRTLTAYGVLALVFAAASLPLGAQDAGGSAAQTPAPPAQAPPTSTDDGVS